MCKKILLLVNLVCVSNSFCGHQNVQDVAERAVVPVTRPFIALSSLTPASAPAPAPSEPEESVEPAQDDNVQVDGDNV